MNILCVSPFFPPVRDSESFCGGKMVMALESSGARVTTLYLDAPYLDSRQDHSSIWKPLRERATPVGRRSSSGRFRAARAALQYLTPVWPRWIDDVVGVAAGMHARAPFDLVYSRSLPMFAHVAGYWTARKLARPWVVNINDPWDEHLFPGVRDCRVSRVHAFLSRFWLRRTLASADAVIFPNLRLARYILDLAGTRRSTEVIPHVGAAAPSPAVGQGFVLVHAGKLGAAEVTGRSTRTLLAGLRQFLSLETVARKTTQLRLVGPQDSESVDLIRELNLEDVVTWVGQVTYEQSLEHIAAASVCLLIEAEMKEGIYLPSKLADYLAARKPVLALSPGSGVVADLAGDPGVIRVDHGDVGRVAQALANLFADHLRNGLQRFRPSERLAETFSPGQTSRQFLEVASRLGNCGRASDTLSWRGAGLSGARPAL